MNAYTVISSTTTFDPSRAMYNGIGLTTPRGSGTNGYVQRNLSSLRVKRPRDERGGERDEKDRERLESQLNRQPNADILEHQRKRQLEVKCAELQDMMEEQGWGKKLSLMNFSNISCFFIYCSILIFKKASLFRSVIWNVEKWILVLYTEALTSVSSLPQVFGRGDRGESEQFPHDAAGEGGAAYRCRSETNVSTKLKHASRTGCVYVGNHLCRELKENNKKNLQVQLKSPYNDVFCSDEPVIKPKYVWHNNSNIFFQKNNGLIVFC